MPKQRLQVDSGIRGLTIRPVASPVDTYVQPTKGRGLAQLAQGLSQFAPSLERFAGVVADKNNSEQQARGEAEARKLSEAGKTYAQAAKEGLIRRSDNPFFVAGVKEQFGRVSAERWHEDLVAAMGADEGLQTSTKLEDFDKFVEKHRKEWMAANVGDNRDKFFETGFGNRADVRLTQERDAFAREIGQRIEKQSDDVQFADVQKTIIESIGKVPTDQIAKDISMHNGDLLLQGRNPRQVNLTTARAIGAAAVRMAQDGDPRAIEALELLQKVKGGTGVIGLTSYGTEIYLKTKEAVNNELDSAHRKARTLKDEEREDRSRSTYTEAVQALVANPHSDLTPFLTRVGDIPEAASTLAALQNATTKLTFNTDEGVKQELLTDIYTPGSGITERTIIQRMNMGKLEAPDAAWLIDQLQQVRNEKRRKGPGEDSVFDDFSFKGELSNLKQRFVDPLTGFIGGEKADRAAKAEAMLRASWLKYRRGAGASASIDERNAWLVRESAAIVKQQRGSDGMADENNTPAPDLGGDLQAGWKKAAVITHEDLERIRTEVTSGSISTETRALLQRNGITSPEQFGVFLRTQLGFLTTPASDSTKK